VTLNRRRVSSWRYDAATRTAIVDTGPRPTRRATTLVVR
jgi:hypothetical protein